MWEWVVFGSIHLVCSVNLEAHVFLFFFTEGNALIVWPGDHGYEPAQGLASQVGTNKEMKVI